MYTSKGNISKAFFTNPTVLHIVGSIYMFDDFKTYFSSEDDEQFSINNPFYSPTKFTDLMKILLDNNLNKEYKQEEISNIQDYISLIKFFFDVYCRELTIVRDEDKISKKNFNMSSSQISKKLKSIIEKNDEVSMDDPISMIFYEGYSNVYQVFQGNSKIVSTESSSQVEKKKLEDNGDEILKQSIGRIRGNQYDILFPLKKEGIPTMISSCEKLGQKSAVGNLLDSLDTIREKYERALCHYYSEVMKLTESTIRGIKDDETKFSMFFSGNNKTISFKIIDYIKEVISVQNLEIRYTMDKVISDFMNNLNESKKGSETLQQFLSRLERNDIMKRNNKLYLEDEEIKPGMISKCISIFYLPQNFQRYISGKRNEDENKVDFNEVVQIESSEKLRPYYWQKEAMDIATAGNSMILSGPTSGGKTWTARIIIAKIVSLLLQSKRSEDSNKKLIYCAPTIPLAIQVFSDMIASFKTISDRISIITESFSTPITPNTMVIVGTSKELNDFFTNHKSEVLNMSNIQAKQKLEEYISVDRIEPFFSLIIDEVHTLSPNYNSNIDSTYLAKSLEELIEVLKGHGVSQFIGLSASLSTASINNLKEKIKEKSGIVNINVISYSYSDIGKYEKPTTNIRDDSKFPQEIYPVVYENSTVNKATLFQALSKIEVTGEVVEQLLWKGKLMGVLPGIVFFKTELQTISTLKRFIDYAEKRVANTTWLRLFNSFNTIKKSGEYQDFSEYILKGIHDKINEPVEGSSIPKEFFTELIEIYNSKNPDKMLIEGNFNYSVDLYGLLFEYKQLVTKGVIFSSLVHPLYNFGSFNAGDNLLNPIIDNHITDFGRLLQAQDVDIKKTNPLKDLIIKALKYGIGIITSSVPIAFQVEISALLKKINKDNVKIGYIFCDYTMSLGIDYTFSCEIIMFFLLETILANEFYQLSGRAGRNTGDGKPKRSVVFTVNVANIFEMANLEDLTFDLGNLSSRFINSSNIYNCLVNIIDTFILLRQEIMNKDIIRIDTFQSNNMFPGIDRAKNRSDKIELAKKQVRELYEICKIAAPSIADHYLVPLFSYFQKACYDTIMISAQ